MGRTGASILMSYSYRPPGIAGVSSGVKGLLIANGGAFVLQNLIRGDLVLTFGLTPVAFWAQQAYWQPLTYMFLHGGLLHLLLNMLVLVMFGSALEAVWGTSRFLKYYFLTGIGAGLSNCVLTPSLPIPIIGASGAVYGLLAAYGVLFPDALVYVYLLFPIRAKYLVLIFGGIEFFASLHPGASPVAHLVHLGGMVVGLVYLKWADTAAWLRRTNWKRRYYRETRRRQMQFKEMEELRREIDDLLDKIKEVGMENLTPWERRRLVQASERLKELERS